MNKIMQTVASLFFISFIMAVPVLAQGSPGGHDNTADMLRNELERTDQLIEQAKEAVRASQSPVARFNLEAAIDLQAKAWRAFDNEYPRLAVRLTMQARERAKKALASARTSEQGERVVLAKLERISELLERAREIMIGQNAHSYRTILETARDNIDRAWEFYNSGQFRAALTLANQAEKALDKLIRRTDRDNRNQLNFERRAEAVRQQIERAELLLSDCKSPNAQKLVDQAIEAFQQARQFVTEGRTRAAVQAMQRAKTMVTRAIRECRGDDLLVRRYEKLKSNLERLSEEVAPSDDHGRKFIEMAAEQLRLAEKAFNDNRSEAAAAALKAAEMTMSQLRRYLESGN